eukprot:2087178-Prymnesium_polylepis.1
MDAPQRSVKPLLRSNKLTLSLNPQCQYPQFGEGAAKLCGETTPTPPKKTGRQRAPASTRAAAAPA